MELPPPNFAAPCPVAPILRLFCAYLTLILMPSLKLEEPAWKPSIRLWISLPICVWALPPLKVWAAPLSAPKKPLPDLLWYDWFREAALPARFFLALILLLLRKLVGAPVTGASASKSLPSARIVLLLGLFYTLLFSESSCLLFSFK